MQWPSPGYPAGCLHTPLGPPWRGLSRKHRNSLDAFSAISHKLHFITKAQPMRLPPIVIIITSAGKDRFTWEPEGQPWRGEAKADGGVGASRASAGHQPTPTPLIAAARWLQRSGAWGGSEEHTPELPSLTK